MSDGDPTELRGNLIWLGIPRSYYFRELRGVQVHTESPAGAPFERPLSHELVVLLRTGKPVRLGWALRNSRFADALAARVRQRLAERGCVLA